MSSLTLPCVLLPQHVFEAACTAHRLNGAYVKDTALSEEQPISNRSIMLEILAKNPSYSVSEADRELARSIIAYYQGLTLKILVKPLSEFEQGVLQLAAEPLVERSFTRANLGIIACLPEAYGRNTAYDAVNRRIKFATGGYIEKIGSRVELEVEVLRSVYSPKWECHFVDAVSKGDEPIRFTSRTAQRCDVLKIRGTVKSHRDGSTILSRIKILENKNA